MIISFAWTTPLLLAGRKTVTRRVWEDDRAMQFKAGDLVQAYDRNPSGGRRVAVIRLTWDPYREPLWMVTNQEEKAEGGRWGSAEVFVKAFYEANDVGPGFAPWVIRFELAEIR